MRKDNVIYVALSMWCFVSVALAGIVEDVLGKVTGVNITQKVEEQNQLSVHATAINDERWKTLVENGSVDDVWFVLVTSGKQDDFERLLKESLNDLADEMKDESGVKLGRADYNSDIRELGTRWLLFQVPMYVLAEDKGRTLRFVSPYQITPSTTNIRKLLLDQKYKDLPVWSSSFSYDGDYARYMDLYTSISLYLHSRLDVIPGLVWYIGIASLSSSLLKWMHKDDKKKALKRDDKGKAADTSARDGISARTRSKTRSTKTKK